MKTIVFSFLISFCIYSLHAQDKVSFENQNLGLAFVGNANWSYVDSSNDFFELENGNHNLNLRIWSVKERMSVQSYLPHLINSEGMVCLKEPFRTEIDDKKAFGVIAVCNEKRQPVRMLFVAFESDDGINIIRFKCPDECFQNHRKQMIDLINAIKILDKSGSQLLIAGCSLIS